MPSLLTKRGQAQKGAKKKQSQFIVDCSKPVEDGLMDLAIFEKFLRDRIKVDNKPGRPAANYNSMCVAECNCWFRRFYYFPSICCRVRS